jgi:hypothetical protein
MDPRSNQIRRAVFLAAAVLPVIGAVALTGPIALNDQPTFTDARVDAIPPEHPRCNSAIRPHELIPRAGNGGESGQGAGIPSCVDCETAQCAMRQAACDNAVGDVAGVPKSELCHRVLECVRDTGCASATGNVSDCICGVGVTLGACARRSLAEATGDCKDLMVAGLETTSLEGIATQLCDPSYATSLAVQLLQCRQSLCAASCEMGGNDSVSPSATAQEPQRACIACQAGQPLCNARRLACENAVGQVHGIPKSELCREVLECFRATGCASAGRSTSDCLCERNADGGMCQGREFSELTGACKDVIAAGLDSTDLAEIEARFGDPEYATGLAVQLIQCGKTFCGDACAL